MWKEGWSDELMSYYLFIVSIYLPSPYQSVEFDENRKNGALFVL